MLLVSEKIRDLRTHRGWTQQTLAEMCDVSVRTIQRVEKDGIASMETTLALASVLETESASLLRDGGVMPPPTGLVARLVPLGLFGLTVFLIGLGVGIYLGAR